MRILPREKRDCFHFSESFSTIVGWVDEETQYFKGKNALMILDFSDRGFADNKERSPVTTRFFLPMFYPKHDRLKS
jgi:hypothetical protein